MKQRKVAISLAIVGAAAAPFILGTFKARPISNKWVSITAGEKVSIIAYLAETNDCQVLRDRVDKLGKLDADALLRNNDYLNKVDCDLQLQKLIKGGQFESGFDSLKYVALNAASVAAGFGVIYGLAFLLPALVRRYWRWLNT